MRARRPPICPISPQHPTQFALPDLHASQSETLKPARFTLTCLGVCKSHKASACRPWGPGRLCLIAGRPEGCPRGHNRRNHGCGRLPNLPLGPPAPLAARPAALWNAGQRWGPPGAPAEAPTPAGEEQALSAAALPIGPAALLLRGWVDSCWPCLALPACWVACVGCRGGRRRRSSRPRGLLRHSTGNIPSLRQHPLLPVPCRTALHARIHSPTFPATPPPARRPLLPQGRPGLTPGAPGGGGSGRSAGPVWRPAAAGRPLASRVCQPRSHGGAHAHHASRQLVPRRLWQRQRLP